MLFYKSGTLQEQYINGSALKGIKLDPKVNLLLSFGKTTNSKVVVTGVLEVF